MKTELDTEKEYFLMWLWILPLIPQICIFILITIGSPLYWPLFFISLIWFIIFGFLFYFFHTTIAFEKDKLLILNRRKIRKIYFSEILYIEERYRMKDSYSLHKLKLFYRLDEKERSIVIRNKKIQKNINELFIGVKIIKQELLD